MKKVKHLPPTTTIELKRISLVHPLMNRLNFFTKIPPNTLKYYENKIK